MFFCRIQIFLLKYCIPAQQDKTKIVFFWQLLCFSNLFRLHLHAFVFLYLNNHFKYTLIYMLKRQQSYLLSIRRQQKTFHEEAPDCRLVNAELASMVIVTHFLRIKPAAKWIILMQAFLDSQYILNSSSCLYMHIQGYLYMNYIG